MNNQEIKYRSTEICNKAADNDEKTSIPKKVVLFNNDGPSERARAGYCLSFALRKVRL